AESWQRAGRLDFDRPIQQQHGWLQRPGPLADRRTWPGDRVANDLDQRTGAAAVTDNGLGRIEQPDYIDPAPTADRSPHREKTNCSQGARGRADCDRPVAVASCRRLRSTDIAGRIGGGRWNWANGSV